MKTYNLSEGSDLYTSNAFYILGEWNTLEDINTLVDVGSDPMIIQKLDAMNAGLGKNKVDQIIITHNHSDHVGMLQMIKERYNPKVYAADFNLKSVDHVLHDGEKIRIGEMTFEVFHITAHSSDSICLYCEENGILFAGDTSFPLEFENRILKEENAYPISRLQGKKIKMVYSGHGSANDYTTKKFMLTRK